MTRSGFNKHMGHLMGSNQTPVGPEQEPKQVDDEVKQAIGARAAGAVQQQAQLPLMITINTRQNGFGQNGAGETAKLANHERQNTQQAGGVDQLELEKFNNGAHVNYFQSLSDSDREQVIERARQQAKTEFDTVNARFGDERHRLDRYDSIAKLNTDIESALAYMRQVAPDGENLTAAYDNLSDDERVHIAIDARREALKEMATRHSAWGLSAIDDLRKSDPLQYKKVLDSIVVRQLSLADQEEYRKDLEQRARADAGINSTVKADSLSSSDQMKLTNSMRALLNDEQRNVSSDRRIAAKERRRLLADYDPLRVVDINRTESMEELAYSAARQKLNEELSKYDDPTKMMRFAKIRKTVSSMWKGNVFRGYYERKYQRNILKDLSEHNDQVQAMMDNGGKVRYEDLTRDNKPAALDLIERMMRDREEYLSSQESRIEVDKESQQYKDTVDIIKKYATSDDMSDADFREAIDSIRRNGQLEKGTPRGQVYLDNYVAVANYVKESLAHQEGLRNVDEEFGKLMSDFKIYEATSAEGVRTREHRSRTDKLVEKLGHSRFGSVLPMDVIAGAASAAVAAAQGAARSKAANMLTFGGSAAVTGALAAMRESNRITTDRATAMRNAAESNGGYHAANKRGEKLKESIYDMAPASRLKSEAAEIDELYNDPNAIEEAIKRSEEYLTELIMRREISDRRKIDLIGYNGKDAIESQRLALVDAQLSLQEQFIQAKLLKDPNFDFQRDFRGPLMARIDNIDNMDINASSDKGDALGELMSDVQKKDELFKKFRRRKAIQRGVAVGAMSLATSTLAYYVGHQLAEHMADNTPGAPNEASGGGGGESAANASQAANQGAGAPHTIEQPPRAEFHRTGWYDNGTIPGDGSELSGHYVDNGMIYDPHDAFSSNGMSITSGEILDRASHGQIKMLLSPTEDASGNPFEITGRVQDGKVFFDVDPQSIAGQMLRDKSFAYAEIVDSSNGMVFTTESGVGLPDFQQIIDQTATQSHGGTGAAGNTNVGGGVDHDIKPSASSKDINDTPNIFVASAASAVAGAAATALPRREPSSMRTGPDSDFYNRRDINQIKSFAADRQLDEQRIADRQAAKSNQQPAEPTEPQVDIQDQYTDQQFTDQVEQSLSVLFQGFNDIDEFNKIAEEQGLRDWYEFDDATNTFKLTQQGLDKIQTGLSRINSVDSGVIQALEGIDPQSADYHLTIIDYIKSL